MGKEMEALVIAPVESPVAAVRKIINVKMHFAERWAERVIGMSHLASKEYAKLNFELIKEHANKTFEHSVFVWQGQLYDNITRKYYMDDDIVLVVNTTGDAMITTYKVDFGFPGDGNSQARKALVKEIHRLSKEKEDSDFQVLIEMEKKKNELVVIDENILISQAQLTNLKEHKVFIESEIKNINRNSNHLDLEIKKFTNMLVNSKEYREDIKSM